MARALLGEIMHPPLKAAAKATGARKGEAATMSALLAVKKETQRLVGKVENEDLRLLVLAVIWAYLGGEFDRMDRNKASGN